MDAISTTFQDKGSLTVGSEKFVLEMKFIII